MQYWCHPSLPPSLSIPLPNPYHESRELNQREGLLALEPPAGSAFFMSPAKKDASASFWDLPLPTVPLTVLALSGVAGTGGAAALFTPAAPPPADPAAAPADPPPPDPAAVPAVPAEGAFAAVVGFAAVDFAAAVVRFLLGAMSSLLLEEEEERKPAAAAATMALEGL